MLSNETKTELLDLIDKLAGLEKERNEIKQKEMLARDKLNLIRAKKLIEIAFAKDNKDRPMYSNEQVREAALILFLDKEPEYSSRRDEVRLLEARLQEISIEHQRLYDHKALLMFETGLANPPGCETRATLEV
jgi:hypothetical protein